jgi:hypothetical protein
VAAKSDKKDYDRIVAGGDLLTPGFASTIAVLEAPAAALDVPAVTTSRSELAPVVLPGTRRFLPLRPVELLAPTFSFVLDASDLESSGGGFDLGGAISRYDIDRVSEECILEQSRGFATMDHLASKSMRVRGRVRSHASERASTSLCQPDAEGKNRASPAAVSNSECSTILWDILTTTPRRWSSVSTWPW